jgi:hypothetical protein
VSLGDSIRRFFNKKNNPALASLESFAADRKGIEGYIEPRTPTSPTTLLLVDRDGEHIRAPVREPEDAVAFCERHGFPVYDAQVIGYPKRMRDFERRRRAGISDSIDDEIAALEKRLAESDPNVPDE